MEITEAILEVVAEKILDDFLIDSALLALFSVN